MKYGIKYATALKFNIDTDATITNTNILRYLLYFDLIKHIRNNINAAKNHDALCPNSHIIKTQNKFII